MQHSSLLLPFFLFCGSSAYADMKAFEMASDQLCEKVKQCTFEQMQREQGLTPEMRGMVDEVLENMCGNLQQFSELETTHELIEPATACMQSMANLSCNEIEESNMQTDSCKKYEEMAKRYHSQS